jgi:hypothetical protein
MKNNGKLSSIETKKYDSSKDKQLPKVRKVKITKDLGKNYKVTVSYLILTDEEVQIKKAIIESILRWP